MRSQKPNLQPLPGSVAESVARHFFQMRRERQGSKAWGSGLAGHRAPFLFLTWLRVVSQKKRPLS